MTNYDETFTGLCQVAFAPCGCWVSTHLQYRDLGERAKADAEFLRDAQRSGAARVETVTMEEFRTYRNNPGEGYEWECPHEPKWGGAQSTHAECPRCWKMVKKKKDGNLASHKEAGFRWTCSQEPLDRAVPA